MSLLYKIRPYIRINQLPSVTNLPPAAGAGLPNRRVYTVDDNTGVICYRQAMRDFGGAVLAHNVDDVSILWPTKLEFIFF